MTKEELDRIKMAYYSGLKVQIWFNGYWEDFDAREYSMYSDPFSENRLYRIVGSEYAKKAEERIKVLEEAKEALTKDKDYFSDALDKQIEATFELHKKNAELEEKLEQAEKDLADYQFNYPTIKELQQENAELKRDNEGYEKDNTRLVQQYNDLQKENADLQKKLDFFMTETVAGKEYRPKTEVDELRAQIEIMKVCSNCKHFNNVDDLEYCQNCERQLVNSLDKLPREEIIKDEWELKE